MPNREEMKMVGQSCSEYDAVGDDVVRSCESCTHWEGEKEMCALDIFFDQLTSLDQT